MLVAADHPRHSFPAGTVPQIQAMSLDAMLSKFTTAFAGHERLASRSSKAGIASFAK
jgi:hypothetical protein